MAENGGKPITLSAGREHKAASRETARDAKLRRAAERQAIIASRGALLASKESRDLELVRRQHIWSKFELPVLREIAEALRVSVEAVEAELPALAWAETCLERDIGHPGWNAPAISERLKALETFAACLRKALCPRAGDKPCADDEVIRALAMVTDEHAARAADEEVRELLMAATPLVERLAEWAAKARKLLLPPNKEALECERGVSEQNPPARTEIFTGASLVLEAIRDAGLPGHALDPAIGGWMDAMSIIYGRLTGKRAAASWDRLNDRPAGFVAFLAIAGNALGIPAEGRAWKERVTRRYRQKRQID